MAYSRMFFATASRLTMKEFTHSMVQAAKEELHITSLLKDSDFREGVMKGLNEAKEIFDHSTSFRQAASESLQAMASNIMDSTSKTRIVGHIANTVASAVVNGANTISSSLSSGMSAAPSSLMRQQGDEDYKTLSRRV